MEIKWVDGYEICVTTDDGAAVIKANREGLLSLATQLVMMATEAPGTHIHYLNGFAYTNPHGITQQPAVRQAAVA